MALQCSLQCCLHIFGARNIIQISILEKTITKNTPGYFDLLAIKSSNIKDIQEKLNKNTSLIDYFFSKEKLHIVVVNDDDVEIIEKDINIKNLNSSADRVYDTLNLQNGNIVPYNVNESFKLNQEVFLFVCLFHLHRAHNHD